MTTKNLLIPLLVLIALPSAWAKGTADHGAPGVTPEQAYETLVAGNQRFVDGKATHPRQDVARRAELAMGQKPHTIVLSCSDSRVPPELVFDQGLGELFVVRVAGNVLGAAAVASMEYAVEHLGARLIVVMGHDSCGAVKAALTTPKGKSAGSPDLDTLVAQIQPNLEKVKPEDDKTIRGPVRANVDGVTRQLTRKSEILRKAVESGKVKVVSAIYALASGKVEFWNNEGVSKR